MYTDDHQIALRVGLASSNMMASRGAMASRGVCGRGVAVVAGGGGSVGAFPGHGQAHASMSAAS